MRASCIAPVTGVTANGVRITFVSEVRLKRYFGTFVIVVSTGGIP
jgi:hypothetical protein